MPATDDRPMRAARERAGLSIAAVADKLQRHPASVDRWERGDTTPPRHCLITLALLYGVEVDELIGGSK